MYCSEDITIKIKAKLSKQELAFCRQHGVDPESVLDATGMAQKTYRAVMSKERWVLAANVTQCKNGGHRLRTGGGHCAICDPKKINYRNRYYEEGIVYLACPLSRIDIIKIGFTTLESYKRQSSLNSEKYAGFNDWRIKHQFKVKNGGRIERRIQFRLTPFQYKVLYFKNREEQTASELFKCDENTALKAIKDVLNVTQNNDSEKKPSKPKKKNTRVNTSQKIVAQKSSLPKSIVEVSKRIKKDNQTDYNVIEDILNNTKGDVSSISPKSFIEIDNKRKLEGESVSKSLGRTKNIATLFSKNNDEILQTLNQKEVNTRRSFDDRKSSGLPIWVIILIVTMIIKGISLLGKSP